MKRCLVPLALALVASSAGLAQAKERKLPTQGAQVAPVSTASLKTVATFRAILVVEPVKRDNLSFGGMAGSSYWFRIRSILRFESEPGVAKEGIWKADYAILSARARNLRKYFKLEWTRLYSRRGPQRAKNAKADAALRRRLVKGRVMVFAVPSTHDFSFGGVLRAGKWASFRGGLGKQGVTLLPLAPADLDRLKGFLKGKARVGFYKPRPMPSPPRTPRKGGERGGRSGGPRPPG